MAQFVNPSVVLLGDKKASPRDLTRLVRQSIAAEQEAVHLYEFIADATDVEWVRRVFQHVADEERVHVGEFQEVLNRLLDNEQEMLEEGAREVSEIADGKDPEKSLLKELYGIIEKGVVRKRPRYKIKNMWKALEEAAGRRRKCFLRYKKLQKNGGGTAEYYVAPYSFRNKPGGEVLFAYDFVDSHVKSFFRERVTGVHVTEKRFVSKWGVEMGSEKGFGFFEPFQALDRIVKNKAETAEKGSSGSPPNPKGAVKSPKPKIVKPSASLRP